MPHCLTYHAILSRRFTFTAATICDNTLYCRPQLVVLYRLYHHEQNQSQIKVSRAGAIQANLVEVVQEKYNLFNQHYERLAGISEIRKIQDRVLEAEQNFVDITQKRKSCQDQIDGFKEKLNNIRDKLESTPRSSEGYLNLITTEHKLLREQLSLEVQLSQFKEKEQLYFDSMSKLLRQSHELERLRQERSKYWQIISIFLSLACSLVALIAQKTRNQQSVLKRMDSFETKLLEIEKLEQSSVLSNERNSQTIQSLSSQIAKLDSKLDSVLSPREGVKVNIRRSKETHGWVSYVPGLTTLTSWIRYFI